MPKNETDFKITAHKLEQDDNNVKLSIVAAATAAIFFRQPGRALGLYAAYRVGARQLTLHNHQQALEANIDWSGKLPRDPYPGFFGGSQEVEKATKILSDLSGVALKFYKESGAQKQVDDLIDKISPPK